MSSAYGTTFGAEYQAAYAKVLKKWLAKGRRVTNLTPAMEAEWAADLKAALGEPLNAALLSSQAMEQWTAGGVELPSKSTLQRFSEIAAVKYALAFASIDLLRRLIKVAKTDKAYPPGSKVTGSVRIARPSELIQRAAQTVAQIFDMAKDRFNSLMNRFLERKQELTGRRRWVSVGDKSRHSMLHHQIRSEGEPFSFKKELIQGPRPPGGNPHDWSNCSCFIEVETKGGKWIRVT